MITCRNLKPAIECTANALIALEDELNALDRAIGDGDHGYNMSRGSQAILDQLDHLSFDQTHQVLTSIGKILMMSVGGASGALYGSLFTSMGNEYANKDENFENFMLAFSAGIDTTKDLGDSSLNQKTMLDVIIPVFDLLKSHGNFDAQKVSETAQQACTSTIDMQAERGRAALLGKRSIGYIDPGAKSSQIIISSICDSLK